jgi:hypothetical protein
MYEIGCMPAFAMSLATRLMLFAINAALLVIACLATMFAFFRMHTAPPKPVVLPSKDKIE